MRTTRNKASGYTRKALLALLGTALVAMLLPGTAMATTAANAVITNTATVNYDDTVGNPQVALSASVNVTVNLVTAQPTLIGPIDQTVSSGIAADYIYTITNNSNGLDTYNLTATDNLPQAGITSQTHVFRDALDTGNIVSIDLGASSVAIAAIAGATAITVPNDGVSDATVNGIVANDFVVIGGNVYQVASVVDNATGTSTINLTAGLLAPAAVGTQIGEQATFISRTTPIATVNLSTYSIFVTADDGVTGGPPTDETITTVLITSLSVVKYVRNITTADPGAGVCVTVDTGLGAGNVQYCDGSVTTVTGNPGNTLEYVIGIANALLGATATDIVISDPVPAFTTQAGNIALDDGQGGGFGNVPTTADNGDFAEVVGNTVYIYAGDGALAGEGDDITDTGGRLDAGETTYGAFQVTIQP